MKKPVNPQTHGIIDYVFSAIQLAGPLILKLNKKTTKTYSMLGSGFLATNMLTDTPVGIALAFHIIFLATAIAHYMLTDYDADFSSVPDHANKAQHMLADTDPIH